MTIIAMLALGLGVTTAMFTLFQQVLLRPLPIPEPERVVALRWDTGDYAFSYPLFRDLEEEQQALAAVAAQIPIELTISNPVSEDRQPAVPATGVSGEAVSGSYFDVLGLEPAAGRLIQAADAEQPDLAPVVVLSHEFWQERFNGDPSVVGSTITLNSRPMTIIGIAPDGFSGVQSGVRARVFVPITMVWELSPFMPRDLLTNRNFSFAMLLGKLLPGRADVDAEGELNELYRRLSPSDGTNRDRGRITLESASRGRGNVPGAATALPVLLAVSSLVLIIVWVNVVNLILVSSEARRGEFAVRASLGATRNRLVVSLFAETAMLIVIGGALGVLLAAALIRVIDPMLPARLSDGLDLGIDGAAIAFAIAMALITGLVAGLVPALRAGRRNVADAINAHTQQTLGVSARASRLRFVLVGGQIALSMVALTLAVLFAASLRNVARVDMGFAVDSLMSFSVSPAAAGMDRERTDLAYSRIREALMAAPGIESVAFASVPIIRGASYEASVMFEEFDSGGEPLSVGFNVVSAGYFSTLSIPLRMGREFTARDSGEQWRVAVVNERLVRTYGLGPDVVGKYVQFGSDATDRLRIVGVVGDAVAEDIRLGVSPQFFVPRGPANFEQNPFAPISEASASFYVRASVDPGTLLRSVPRVVAAVEPDLAVSAPTTLRRRAQEQVFVDRVVTLLSVGFASLATLLAAVGLYAVMSYTVLRRSREFGLRLALGAAPAQLHAFVMRSVITTASLGIVIGAIATLAIYRLVASLLFGVSGTQAVAVLMAAATLSLAIFVAGYLPARRAANTSPMVGLRQ